MATAEESSQSSRFPGRGENVKESESVVSGRLLRFRRAGEAPVKSSIKTVEPTEEELSLSNSSQGDTLRTADLDASSGSSQCRYRGGCMKIQSSSQPLAQNKRNISWGGLVIRSHDIVLGDNPATTSGPPLTIGWNVATTNTLSIDDYEKHRPLRRRMSDLIIPRVERERRLMEAGYSRGELRQMQEKLEEIKRSRKKNATAGPLEKAVRLFQRRRSWNNSVRAD